MHDTRRIVEFTQDDRDMLVRHDTKLSVLCTQIHDLDDTMRDGFQRIIDKMDIQKDTCSEHREKISSRYFTKKVLILVLGLIITSLIGVGIYSGKMSSKVCLNTYKIENLTNKDLINNYYDSHMDSKR